MKKKIIYFAICASLVITVFACKKEIQKIFQVDTRQVSLTTINKTQLKEQIQFISNAYADLFGQAIPPDELSNAVNCYASVGDKDIVTDRIIRSYLNGGNLLLPTQTQMNADP